MSENFRIVQIQPKNWAVYKKIRLEALEQEPMAFGEPLSNAQKRTEAEWIAKMKASVDLFLEKDGEVVGMVGSWQSDNDKKLNFAHMYGVYVRESERGKGNGKMLIRSLLKELKKKRMFKVILTVNTIQTAAMAMYQTLGFLETGRSRARMGDGNYYEEAELEKLL